MQHITDTNNPDQITVVNDWHMANAVLGNHLSDILDSVIWHTDYKLLRHDVSHRRVGI